MNEELEGKESRGVSTGGVWGALTRMWSGDDDREVPEGSPGASWFGGDLTRVVQEGVERLKGTDGSSGELRGREREQDKARKDDEEEARRTWKQRQEEERKKQWEEAQLEGKRKALLTDPMHGMTKEQYELFQKKATEGRKPEEAEKAKEEALTTEFLSSGNRNVPAGLVGAYLPELKQAHAKKEWGYEGPSLSNKEFLDRGRQHYDLRDQLGVAASVAAMRGKRPTRAFAEWERRMEPTHPAWNPHRRHELEAQFTATMLSTKSLMRQYGPGIQRLLPAVDVSTIFGTPPEYAVLADGSIGERIHGKTTAHPVARAEYGGFTVTDAPALLDVMPLAGKQKVYLPNAGLTAAQADDKAVLQWQASMQSIGRSFSYSSAYGGYNMRVDQGSAAKAALNPNGDSAARYMMDLAVARERHERYIEGRATSYRAAFDTVESEFQARREELLDPGSENEATDQDLDQLAEAHRQKIAQMRAQGAELVTEARGYFLNGTLSAQGYRALGDATGMGDLLEAHLDGDESQARMDAVAKGGVPIVSGTRDMLGTTRGALPAVDPLKRREDQKLIAEARNTKRSIKVTLRNGKVLRHELPSVTVNKLEAMRAEAESYLDRNFYDPDKYNIDGTGKRYLRPGLGLTLQEIPKDFPFPEFGVLTAEQTSHASTPEATPGTEEKVPYLLRMMGLTRELSDIKRIEVETPEKMVRPILERMRAEAAPMEAELDKYLDKFDLSPEERAVTRYRIIADATRSIPIGMWEMLSSGERMSEKLPYAGGFIAIANLWHIGEIAGRVAKGEGVSDPEMAVLEHALLDMERDESRAAVIVSGALDILSLGAEFATSGGLGSLGRKGGTEAAEMALREGLQRVQTAEARKALRGIMTRRALNTGVQVGIQTAVPSAHRWAKAAYEDAYIKGVHVYQGPDGERFAQLDAGHQRGSFWDKAPKAIAHALVDNISERTGGLLLKWPGAQEALGKLSTATREELAKRALLQLAIEKMGADKAVRFLSRGHAKIGMHGFHREILEEVDAAFGHALVDGEAPQFMSTDDVINMMVSMVLARGVMGAGGQGGRTDASTETPVQPQPQMPEGGFAAGGNRSSADADIWKPTIGGGSYPAGEDGAGGAASTGVQPGTSAAMGAASHGVQNALGSGEGAGAEQTGIGATPQQPQQSDAPAPALIDAPSTDEASAHAVPPGGTGGMGGNVRLGEVPTGPDTTPPKDNDPGNTQKSDGAGQPPKARLVATVQTKGGKTIQIELLPTDVVADLYLRMRQQNPKEEFEIESFAIPRTGSELGHHPSIQEEFSKAASDAKEQYGNLFKRSTENVFSPERRKAALEKLGYEVSQDRQTEFNNRALSMAKQFDSQAGISLETRLELLYRDIMGSDASPVGNPSGSIDPAHEVRRKEREAYLAYLQALDSANNHPSRDHLVARARKVLIDRLNTMPGGSPKARWGVPASTPTFGHTFNRHGKNKKQQSLGDRAAHKGHQVGHFLDNELACAVVGAIMRRGPGVYDIPFPPGCKGEVMLPDRTGPYNADMLRVVVRENGLLATAFAYNSDYPTE